MATKKQRRAKGLAKRERYMEDLRQEGMAAIARDRAEKAEREKAEWQEGHDKKHFKFVDECPICSEIKAKLASQKPEAEAS